MLDKYGFILTGHDLKHKTAAGMEPLPFEMSVPGLFAAGDARHGSTKQVASAVAKVRRHRFRSESFCEEAGKFVKP